MRPGWVSAMRGFPVRVVLPGATATDFWGIAGMPVEIFLQSWSCQLGRWSMRRWPDLNKVSS
jgi:hypothetical protein